MLDFVVKAWDENQEKLKEALMEMTVLVGDIIFYEMKYKDIMRLIVHFILNGADGRNGKWDEECIHQIDDGEYQGTLLFLVPKRTYQPTAGEYLITKVEYGSCSGCDTLQSISAMDDDPYGKVERYMALCLHMVQSMRAPFENEEDW